MRAMRRLRLILPLAAVALLAACQVSGSPRVGEGNLRVGIPGTAANEAIFQERWNSCIQFASESVCAKRFGGRTPANTRAELQDEHP